MHTYLQGRWFESWRLRFYELFADSKNLLTPRLWLKALSYERKYRRTYLPTYLQVDAHYLEDGVTQLYFGVK